MTISPLASLLQRLGAPCARSIRQRRHFLSATGMVLLTPVVAQAQTRAAKPYRIGILGAAGSAGSPKTFQQDLIGLGYVEGRDVVFEIRNAEGRTDRLDAMAMELVRLNVTVIVAANPASVLSAKRATTTIPIVMMHTPDPVQLGLVSSLARPSG